MTTLLNKEIEKQVEILLSKMTVEEKIGQTNQIHAFEERKTEAIRKGEIGSFLNASGALTGQGQSRSTKAEMCNRIQETAIKESRLGIPLLFGRDVIHGYRTVFPIPLGQAASWNMDLIEAAAAIAAKEASADGIKWTFAPMIDVTRDPRWGRVAEGPGEDPFLGSLIAAAMVRGFQGENLSDQDRLVACAKHYIGYGASEGGRDYDGAEISMPTLREVYLPPYQSAVKAGVGTIMSAFHDLNGIPMTCNKELIQNVLKNELGFQGFVVSDWESVAELVNHGIAADRSDAAMLGIQSGVDMDMVSQSYAENLMECLDKGLLDIDPINDSVRRILRIKHLAGLFDNPYTDPDKAQKTILAPSHRETARALARESIILLKNNSEILPLRNVSKLAVVGPHVHSAVELFGTWSPDGRPEDVQAVSDAFQEILPKSTQISFAEHEDDAVRIAAESQVVIAVMGETPGRSGENANVANLELPPGQSEFIQSLADQGTPIILIILSGRPLAIPREIALSHAAILVFHPGIEGAAAIVETLIGSHVPCAKLPITMPRTTGQIPVYYNHKNSGRPTGQGPFQTRYVDTTHRPLFPFGFGLSYTNFSYDNLALSDLEMDEQLTISAEITNKGSFPGTEIVQLYVRDLVGRITRPVKQLKGFKRINLNPGDTQQVQFQLSREDLLFWTEKDSYIAEPGQFHVWIGPSSDCGLQDTFTLV